MCVLYISKRLLLVPPIPQTTIVMPKIDQDFVLSYNSAVSNGYESLNDLNRF